MNRRDLLRNLALGAGAALSAPLLHRYVRADTGRCRFLFVVEGNGFEPVTVLSDETRRAIDDSLDTPIDGRRWWYRRYRHDSPIVVDTPDLASARSLGALGELDLVDQASVVLGLSGRVIGGGHSAYHGALSAARTVGGAPGGPTIDAFLAAIEGVRQDTPFDAIRLGVGGGRPLDFGTVAFAAGRPAPMILDPVLAYNVLFGAFTDGPSRQLFDDRAQILDFAHADLEAARAAFGGGASERAKLDELNRSIESLQATQARLSAMEVIAPTGPSESELFTSGDPLERLEAQLQLATSALINGLTNVAVVGSGTGGAFSLTYSSISRTNRHDMQHGSAGSDALLNAVHDVTAAQVAAIGRAAKRLQEAPTDGGNVLDETIIVYVGDNGEQHHSTASEFPILMLGGRALGHRGGGRSIVYPRIGAGGAMQLSNLWNTVGHFAGQDLNDFGDSAARALPGPLEELFV